MLNQALIARVFDTFTAKDLEGLMALFADDAVVYDPHYPHPRMVGRAAIRRGMTWGMATLEKPGFTIRQVWLDGNSGVVELDTHHVIRGSMKAEFDQMFAFETRDSLITRMQSYVPYRAHGIAGLIPRLSALGWRLRGNG